MNRSDTTFAVIIAGFGGGVLMRSLVPSSGTFSLFLLFVAAALFVYALMLKRFGSGPRGAPWQTAALGGLCVAAVALGTVRVAVSATRGLDPVLSGALGQSVVLSGLVAEEPDVRETTTRLTVDARSLRRDGKDVSAGGRILVIADHYPAFHYGDTISFSGELQAPENWQDPESVRQFDYVAYLAKDGIRYQMIRPAAVLQSSGGGSFVVRNLVSLKAAFMQNISALIPEPEAALEGGLVVGAKQSLGKSLLDDFRRVGLIHTVVLSGYNVTIVADFMMKLFSFLPRVFGLSFGAVSIVLFAIMTGASATVVRASIMALLVVVARATGRAYDIKRALFIAGFFMVLQNPAILVFDVSFQLSFLSTVGLIYVSPLIERLFYLIPEKLNLRSIVASTVSTQLFVLPLLLYTVGVLSIVGVVVNILVLPLIPWTMLFGFLAGALGFLHALISLPFAFVAYALLWYELKVVALFSALPFAAVTANINEMTMLLLYAVYGVVLFAASRLFPVKLQKKKPAAA